MIACHSELADAVIDVIARNELPSSLRSGFDVLKLVRFDR
jgi:hypothetical protein